MAAPVGLTSDWFLIRAEDLPLGQMLTGISPAVAEPLLARLQDQGSGDVAAFSSNI